MRPKTRTDLSVLLVVLIFGAFAGVLAVSVAGESQEKQANGNSKCYVCHPSMKTEAISTIHGVVGVTCDECHGPSVEHMHDEMLMTEPDLLFGRSEVEKMCSNSTCHKPGEGRYVYGLKDHNDPVTVKAFHKKWSGRMRPNGRAITSDSVCTDCHGTHNLDKSTGPRVGDEEPAEWVSAFNGLNLAGWRPSGAASWSVKGGRLIAKPGTNGKGGAVWTEAVYKDYLLAVTFRATWPIHAGIWLRAAGSEKGPRVEIFDSRKPQAFTGSVWVPDKGLALANLREDLVDRESWNTISVKVKGDRIQVWLNGEEIGAVRVDSPAKGNIGLYIEKHPASKTAELCVREVLVQRLGETQEKVSAPSEN